MICISVHLDSQHFFSRLFNNRGHLVFEEIINDLTFNTLYLHTLNMDSQKYNNLQK